MNHLVGEICAPEWLRAGVPPAMPQASSTGAVPGARHGVDIHLSSEDMHFASRLTVRSAGSQMVGFILLLQKSVFLPAREGPGQRESVGMHSGQPMEQPLLNPARHISRQVSGNARVGRESREAARKADGCRRGAHRSRTGR